MRAYKTPRNRLRPARISAHPLRADGRASSRITITGRWRVRSRGPGSKNNTRDSYDQSVQSPDSEIRLVGHRYMILELRIVLGTGLFLQRRLSPLKQLCRLPRLIEGVGVLDGDVN